MAAFWVVLAAAAAVSAAAAGPVRFANPLGDHMVLQAGGASQVWGFAPAGAEVTVTLASPAPGAPPARTVAVTASASDGR